MPPIRNLDEAFLSQLLGQDLDIKDIALSSNIDTSSLSIVLKKLDATSNALQKDIFNKVHENFDDFSGLYNDSQSIQQKVLELLKQVSRVQDQVKTSSSNTYATIETYQQALFESQKNQLKIDTLEKIQHILKELQVIQNQIKLSDYDNIIVRLNQSSKSVTDWSEGDERVKNLIHQQISQLKQSLISQLQDDVRTAIQFNKGSMRILNTFQPSNGSKSMIYIYDVFKCLHQLNILAEELMGVERLIFKNILYPYFENIHSVLQMDPVETNGVGKGGVLQVIQHTPANQDDEPVLMDPVVMIQQIDSIIGFLYQYMFRHDDKEMKKLFGNLLSPELFELMIQKSITPAIPSSKEYLADFDRVTDTVKTFENRCRDMYSFQEETDTLGSFVNNIDKHYAKKRCEKILQQGRRVMVRRLYDTEPTQITAEDGHTYHYQITQTPQILSVLISDTFAEADELVDTHPISASTLKKGVQDLLDMYRAIMPSFHRSQYLSNAGNALVFRNDCFWLAHELVKKSDELKESSDRLRELGKAWHELTLTQCVQMIQRILEPLDGFSGMSENNKFQQNCDQAITQTIDVIKRFATETRPVVDETVFLDMLGRVVDRLLNGFISDIESLVDIGAEESHIIARTLNSLAQLVDAFDLPGRDATESFVMDLVPSWQKFWLVKDILEMNMRDIMESYRRGDLHMFEKSELVGLLCSLFADTDLRQSNIEEIKTGKRVQEEAPSANTKYFSSFDDTDDILNNTSQNIPPSKSANFINRGLEYTPDEDMEEMGDGWGQDDDDLFIEEDKSQEPQEPQETASKSSNLNILDIDLDEAEAGWGDEEDDIFIQDEHISDKHDHELEFAQENDKQTHEQLKEQIKTDELETSQHLMSEDVQVEDVASEPVKINDDIKQESTATISSKNTLSFSAPDLDMEDGGDGWGWDDDEDLFHAEQKEDDDLR